MKITKLNPAYSAALADTTTLGTAAGGDTSGSLPNPTVVGIQGTPVDPLPGIATEYLNGAGHFTTPTGVAGTLIIEDEGTPLATPGDTLNFAGAGVTASGTGTTKLITIPGGATADVVNVAVGAGSVVIPGLKGSPDAVPGSPSATDQEFDTLTGTVLGTLDTDNITDVPSHWHAVRNTGATNSLNGRYWTAPSMPFTVEARFFAGPGPTGAANWGLMLGDATPTAWYEWGPAYSGWGAWNDILSAPWTNISTRGATVDNNMTGLIYPYPKWLRMVVHASNNIDLAISEDGYYWRTIRTAQDSGLTVAKVGIAVGSAGGTGTPDILVDYLRFT